jgi:SAM-dependent methyltransferase
VIGGALRRSIAKLPADKSRLKLLDIGAADGNLTSHYAGLAKSVVAMDISEPLLQQFTARPELARATTVAGNAEALIAPGKPAAAFRRAHGRFDAIVMSHMLFALGDPVATVKGAVSMLEKRGKIFIIVPDDEGQFQKFRREFVSRTSLNPGSNLPSTELINGLERLGYKVAVGRVEGTFAASFADMRKMAPILGDVAPEAVAHRPEVLHTLDSMLSSHGRDGRVSLSNDSLLIEVER